jgi:hypothetical protein
MIKKELTIAGKQVTLAYCYATELAYKDYTNEDITDFIPEIINSTQAGQMPDTKKSIYLILSAIMAAAQSKDEEPAITDKELMFEASPEDMGNALASIIMLRLKFYNIPLGEPKDKPSKGGKKAKNS